MMAQSVNEVVILSVGWLKTACVSIGCTKSPFAKVYLNSCNKTTGESGNEAVEAD